MLTTTENISRIEANCYKILDTLDCNEFAEINPRIVKSEEKLKESIIRILQLVDELRNTKG